MSALSESVLSDFIGGGGGGGAPTGPAGGDLTGTYPNPSIASNAVDNTKAADMATATIKGRETAGSGNPEDLSATQVRSIINVADGATANSTDAFLLNRTNHTGTQTLSTISDSGALAALNTVGSTQIDDNSVTNAKLANMSTQTFKGRNTAGSGDPEDLSATTATTILNAMVGDSGSGGTKGLVPAPATGDATKFLTGAGTWATVIPEAYATVAASGAEYTTVKDAVDAGETNIFVVGDVTETATVSIPTTTEVTVKVASDVTLDMATFGFTMSGTSNSTLNLIGAGELTYAFTSSTRLVAGGTNSTAVFQDLTIDNNSTSDNTNLVLAMSRTIVRNLRMELPNQSNCGINSNSIDVDGITFIGGGANCHDILVTNLSVVRNIVTEGTYSSNQFDQLMSLDSDTVFSNYFHRGTANAVLDIEGTATNLSYATGTPFNVTILSSPNVRISNSKVGNLELSGTDSGHVFSNMQIATLDFNGTTGNGNKFVNCEVLAVNGDVTGDNTEFMSCDFSAVSTFDVDADNCAFFGGCYDTFVITATADSTRLVAPKFNTKPTDNGTNTIEITSSTGGLYKTVGASGADYTTLKAAIDAGESFIAVIDDTTETADIAVPINTDTVINICGSCTVNMGNNIFDFNTVGNRTLDIGGLGVLQFSFTTGKALFDGAIGSLDTIKLGNGLTVDNNSTIANARLFVTINEVLINDLTLELPNFASCGINTGNVVKIDGLTIRGGGAACREALLVTDAVVSNVRLVGTFQTTSSGVWVCRFRGKSTVTNVINDANSGIQIALETGSISNLNYDVGTPIDIEVDSSSECQISNSSIGVLRIDSSNSEFLVSNTRLNTLTFDGTVGNGHRFTNCVIGAVTNNMTGDNHEFHNCDFSAVSTFTVVGDDMAFIGGCYDTFTIDAAADRTRVFGTKLNTPITDNSATSIIVNSAGGGSGGGLSAPLLVATVSGGAGFDFESNIDSTYNTYLFVSSGITNSVDGVEYDALTSTNGGTSYDATSYRQALRTLQDNGTETDENQTSAAQMRLTAPLIGNASGEHFSFIAELNNPSNASLVTTMNVQVNYITSFGRFARSYGIVGRDVAEAVNSISFGPSTGTTTGTVIMYGYNKS